MTNDKIDPCVSISISSMAALICVGAALAKTVPEARPRTMQTARTILSVLRMNKIKVEFEWADPNFAWEKNQYCELKSVTIDGQNFKVLGGGC